MSYGNKFHTGGNVVDGELAKSPYSQVYDNEEYALGTVRIQSPDETASEAHTADLADTSNPDNLLGLKGAREWVFVKAFAEISQYSMAIVNAVGTSYEGKNVASDDDEVFDLIGVAQVTIAAGKFGWVCKRGEVVVVGTGVTAGNFLTSDGTTAAGSLKPSTTAGDIVGRGLTATNTLPSGSTLSGKIGAYISIP